MEKEHILKYSDSVSSPWHSRGYLPHFDACETIQHIIFRLADAIPRQRMERWTAELERLSTRDKEREWNLRVEQALDSSYGACHLRIPKIAKVVQDAILRFDGKRYCTYAWVIMPNHVHILVSTFENISMSSIIHSWKSFTATAANRSLGLKGKFWQEDYYDRFMRNEKHYNAVHAYIVNNPVKAGLCLVPEEWAFGSAHFEAGN